MVFTEALSELCALIVDLVPRMVSSLFKESLFTGVSIKLVRERTHLLGLIIDLTTATLSYGSVIKQLACSAWILLTLSLNPLSTVLGLSPAKNTGTEEVRNLLNQYLLSNADGAGWLCPTSIFPSRVVGTYSTLPQACHGCLVKHRTHPHAFITWSCLMGH